MSMLLNWQNEHSEMAILPKLILTIRAIFSKISITLLPALEKITKFIKKYGRSQSNLRQEVHIIEP